jgi:C-terminal processing protease CtpA/Prc
VGDIITAVDGKPVATDGLSDARIALRARPAGTKVQIALTRGTEKKLVTLVLRDQI